MTGIDTLQDLMRRVLKEIPLSLTVILMVATVSLWWQEGGEEVARRILMRRRMAWFFLFLGGFLLLVTLVMIGYLLDSGISWWYVLWSAVGSFVCIILLKLFVSFSAININGATEEQLATLPPIGPELARQIIEYREQNGGFGEVKELKKVPGIDDRVFEQIASKIRVKKVIRFPLK
jgi:competence ComEA-like helix-hairpin-helix protein